LAPLLATTASAQSLAGIQKCQDENGRWFYGGSAASRCRSAITTLNLNGIVISTRDPFKPRSGLQQAAIVQQQKNDLRLLRRYSSLTAIGLEKTRKLAELENQQSINFDLIQKLKNELQNMVELNTTNRDVEIDERRQVIRQYQSRRDTLSRKVEQLNAGYSLLSSDYMQAQARQHSQK